MIGKVVKKTLKKEMDNMDKIWIRFHDVTRLIHFIQLRKWDKKVVEKSVEITKNTEIFTQLWLIFRIKVVAALMIFFL